MTAAGGWSLDEFLGEGDEDYTVDVPIKPRALAKKHAELEQLLIEQTSANTSLAGDGSVRAMAEGLEELSRRIDEGTKVYTFRGVSRRRWRGLMAKYPPSKRDREQGLDFDPDKFPTAAIALCSVDPKLTDEEAKALEDDDSLGPGGFEQLWAGVLTANLGVLSDTPKSVLATSILRTNDASSTTAAPEASPGASS